MRHSFGTQVTSGPWLFPVIHARLPALARSCRATKELLDQSNGKPQSLRIVREQRGCKKEPKKEPSLAGPKEPDPVRDSKCAVQLAGLFPK